MVVTRRSRSANNSLASNGNDDDTGSFISARDSRIARGGAPPPPPPPTPPPLPPPPPQLGAPDRQQGPVADTLGAHEMAAIPEEVELNNNIVNDTEGGNNMNEGNNGMAFEPNDNNIATIAIPPPAPAPAHQPIQYLQVRVPPPSQSQFLPSRIHRRHHHRSPPSNNTPNTMHNRNRPQRKGKGSSPSSPRNEGEIVRVLIPRNGFASERQLAECLSQAGAAEFGRQDEYHNRWDDDFGDDYSMDEYFDDGREKVLVAGMFRESDRVFVPLSIIYSDSHSFVGEVLCLKRPPPPPKRSQFRPTTKPRRSIFLTFLELMGIALVAFASWYMYGSAQLVDWEYVLEEAIFKIEKGFFATINFPFWLFDVLIEFPLREIYRHGPSVIGWEGEPLPRICARITYHGDESFWSRNIEECEQIYYAKESAAMQVRKPIVIGFLILMLFYMIKSIVAARALRRRERIDPNMVETYRAIQMLTRQLRRAVNTR